MKHNHRSLAREALARAEGSMEGGDEQALRYAALDLRLAMEALTYDRAEAYLKELPLDALAKWQPKQLMDALIEIDPTVGSTYTLRMGEEPSPGVSPETMSTLGNDVVLGLEEIKKHYHALGSFLHMPTLQQLKDAKGWDAKKVRMRLQDTAQKIGSSLSSPVWNCTLGEFSNFACCRCDKPIHKRVVQGQRNPVARCIYCNAPHAGHLLDEGSVEWRPMTMRSPCPTAQCTHVLDLWLDEIKRGTCWKCPQCHERYRIDLSIVQDDQHEADGDSFDGVKGAQNG